MIPRLRGMVYAFMITGVPADDGHIILRKCRNEWFAFAAHRRANGMAISRAFVC